MKNINAHEVQNNESQYRVYMTKLKPLNDNINDMKKKTHKNIDYNI